MEFSYDALTVSEVRRKLPGSFFEHCELAFNCSLAVWVVIHTVEDVSEFLDGVEVDSVIQYVGVDHSVSIAFEKRCDVHHLVLVIA